MQVLKTHLLFFLLNFSSVRLQISFSNNKGICRTNGGPSPNQKCVIPFKWNGKVHDKCPQDLDDPSKYWCSTKVDAKGVHIPKKGKELFLSVLIHYKVSNQGVNFLS